MRRYTVTGHVDVTVTTIVSVEGNEELTDEEICDRAYEQFGGVESFAGFGDCSHMIGVSGADDTIETSGDVEFTGCEAE